LVARILKVLILSTGLLPLFCAAQIVNGDFQSGGSGWSWSQGSAPADNPSACFTSMQPFSPKNTEDVIQVYWPSSLGRSARVSGYAYKFPAYAQYATYCRQVSQALYVDPGAVLKLDATVGISSLSSINSPALRAVFTVSAVDNLSGTEFLLYKEVGANFYCQPNCTNFSPKTVDISAVWGRSVELRFKTSVYNVPTSGGAFVGDPGVYIDNVRLEQLPIPAWPFKSGSWYNKNRSGHGIHLSRAGNGSFTVIWYTYLADGRPVWYISESKPASNGVWQATLFKSSWNQGTGTNSLLPVGDTKIEMTDKAAMIFSWDLYSINGNNAGFDGAEPFVFLSGGGSYTGLWYEPSYSGWGLSLEYLDNPAGIDTVATAFYYAGSEPVWSQGAVEGTPTGNKLIQLTEYTGIGLCPECIGQQTQMWPWPAGMLSLDLDAQRGWIEAQSHSGFPWNRGSSSQPAEIVRMTGP
jgi:hypothetical protein